MTQTPDDQPDFLAKPVPPSGEQPEAPPTYGGGAEPTSPYVAQGPSHAAPPPAPMPTTPYGQYGQPGQYGQYPQQGGYAPYAPVPGMPGYPFTQPHGSANIAMGLGIASLVCAVLTPFVCFTIPGVLCGPFAIVLAARARGDMKNEPGRYSNEGAATAGLVTGIIGTVLGLAMIALVVFVIGAVFSVGS